MAPHSLLDGIHATLPPCHSKPSAKLLKISLTLANWTLCYSLNSHCSSFLCLVLFFLMFFCDVPCSSLTVFCASCNLVQTLKAQRSASSSTKLSLTAPTGGTSSPPAADFILHFVFINKIAHFTMQLYYLCLCLSQLPSLVVRTIKSNLLSDLFLSLTAFSIALLVLSKYLFSKLRICLDFPPIIRAVFHPYRHIWFIFTATIHSCYALLAHVRSAILSQENSVINKTQSVPNLRNKPYSKSSCLILLFGMQKAFFHKNNVINSGQVLSRPSQDNLTHQYLYHFNYRQPPWVTLFCGEILALHVKAHLACPRGRTEPGHTRMPLALWFSKFA